MKSGRTVVSLHYTEEVETAQGVIEPQETILKDIRAIMDNVFQTRLDQALADGMPITWRFEIREHYLTPFLDYLIFKGIRYKIHQIIPSIHNHYMVVECGEQMGGVTDE